MALIEAEGVHVRFGDRVVLEQVDLAVPEGELHGIMGPNGAGKTTFFNVLTGRVRPSRGRIRLDGEDLAGLSPHAIANKGVARSFQIMTLFDEFTARENVMVALPEFRRRGYDVRRAVAGDAQLAQAAGEVLTSVGLADKGEVTAKQLSPTATGALWKSPWRWRSGRACSASTSPPPAFGSDGTQRLAELIGRLKSRLTIVAIEHDMEFLSAGRPHLGDPLGPGGRARKPGRAAAERMGEALQPRAVRMILEVAGIDTFYGETQALFGVRSPGAGRGAGAARPQAGRQDHHAALVLGLTRPRRGTVRFDGRDVTRTATHDRPRRRRPVPDDRRLCPTLTVARNLAIAQKHALRPWSVKEATEIFSPLEYLMERECENLSGGEMQMVAIARALVGSPGLVLFDEPSQGLAPKIVGDVLATVRRLKSEGIASLIVEQNAEIALSVADRAAVIDRGRIAWTGVASELAGDAALRQRLLGA